MKKYLFVFLLMPFIMLITSCINNNLLQKTIIINISGNWVNEENRTFSENIGWEKTKILICTPEGTELVSKEFPKGIKLQMNVVLGYQSYLIKVEGYGKDEENNDIKIFSGSNVHEFSSEYYSINVSVTLEKGNIVFDFTEQLSNNIVYKAAFGKMGEEATPVYYQLSGNNSPALVSSLESGTWNIFIKKIVDNSDIFYYSIKGITVYPGRNKNFSLQDSPKLIVQENGFSFEPIMMLSPRKSDLYKISMQKIGNYIYILGGEGEDGFDLRTRFERLDLTTQKTDILSTVPSSQTKYYTFAYNEKLYLIYPGINYFYIYDPSNNLWSQTSEISDLSLSGNISIHVNREFVYFITPDEIIRINLVNLQKDSFYNSGSIISSIKDDGINDYLYVLRNNEYDIYDLFNSMSKITLSYVGNLLDLSASSYIVFNNYENINIMNEDNGILQVFNPNTKMISATNESLIPMTKYGKLIYETNAGILDTIFVFGGLINNNMSDYIYVYHNEYRFWIPCYPYN